MKKSLLIILAVGAVLGIVAYKLLWTAVGPKLEHRLAEIVLTSNEIAAQGPLPGDLSLYEKELRASEALSTPGYYPSINGAEIADAQRSGLFPQATFTGSFDGPNQVYAWRSEDAFDGVTYINNRKPGELFLVGGDTPAGKLPIPAGPFVAKVDATTGRQIWRTFLDNANVSGNWIGNANLNILNNGTIAFAWATQVVLLDADTGRILKQNTLPTGETAPADSNFKHLTVAPDRTLILKNQTRPTGSQDQGTMAIIKGVDAGLKQGNSELVAVNPDTLEILDHLSLPEPATVPHIITMFQGKIAIYIGVNSGALRYFWDPASRRTPPGSSPRCRKARPPPTRRACWAIGSFSKPTASAARPSPPASSR